MVASRPVSPARKSGDHIILPTCRRNARADSEEDRSVHGNHMGTRILRLLLIKWLINLLPSQRVLLGLRIVINGSSYAKCRTDPKLATRRNLTDVPKFRVPKPAAFGKEFSKVAREAEKLTPAEREDIARRSKKLQISRQRSI